jgi:hypothetical protein
MAQLDIEIIEAAYQLKLIPKTLTDAERLVYAMCALTANDSEHTSKEVNLHPNTVKLYCRWLRSKNLLTWINEGQGNKIIYFGVSLDRRADK